MLVAILALCAVGGGLGLGIALGTLLIAAINHWRR